MGKIQKLGAWGPKYFEPNLQGQNLEVLIQTSAEDLQMVTETINNRGRGLLGWSKKVDSSLFQMWLKKGASRKTASCHENEKMYKGGIEISVQNKERETEPETICEENKVTRKRKRKNKKNTEEFGPTKPLSMPIVTLLYMHALILLPPLSNKTTNETVDTQEYTKNNPLPDRILRQVVYFIKPKIYNYLTSYIYGRTWDWLTHRRQTL